MEEKLFRNTKVHGAEGIATYVKKQSGPASVEIKSAEDATNLIGENKVVIVGVFFKFFGEEYENFTALAEKLRSDYEFGYTLDAKHLPRGESSVPGPVVWLFKPFDELTVDFQAMFFVNFSSEFDAHKKKYSEVAKEYKGKGISFLLGDIEASEGAFQYFGVKEEQVPLVIIQTDDQKKYIKSNVEPEQIATWIKVFKEGKVSLHKKSEPIPQTND